MPGTVVDGIRLPAAIVEDQQATHRWLDRVSSDSRHPASMVGNSGQIHQSSHQTLPGYMRSSNGVRIYMIFVCARPGKEAKRDLRRA